MVRRGQAGGVRLAGRLGLLAALLAATPGCSSWRASQAGAAEVSAMTPDRARVTLRNGSTVVLSSPVVQGDSLVGIARPKGGEPVRFAAAVGDVVLVETRGFSTGKTLGVVALGAITVAVVSVGLLVWAFSTADF